MQAGRNEFVPAGAIRAKNAVIEDGEVDARRSMLGKTGAVENDVADPAKEIVRARSAVGIDAVGREAESEREGCPTIVRFIQTDLRSPWWRESPAIHRSRSVPRYGRSDKNVVRIHRVDGNGGDRASFGHCGAAWGQPPGLTPIGRFIKPHARLRIA